MNYSNYHTHTIFCDGADSPEELVLEAIHLGCPEIGFSGHSFLKEDSGSMSPKDTQAYCAEVRRLKTVYFGRINILLGIELDYYSELPRDEHFDYVIGAVHYVKKDGLMLAVDESRDGFLQTVRDVYWGDYYGFAEDYYREVADLHNKTCCDIIAHFDLIAKYNEGNSLFDTGHPRYVAAATAALDSLMNSHSILEINTGAIARGYRSEAYPERWILGRWLDAGKPVILSSDCHDRRQLLFGFPQTEMNVPCSEQMLSSLSSFITKRNLRQCDHN